ncbi:MDR family NADPH-dependent oxidoreductase [Nitrospirillum viridazoti]|uniref:enoyl-[acyl-carrier-protein] reductase n=1 Tax=Nitrospirillum viridazoti CBAmc TaxID=1441467 RepID=A0A248JUP2_9PROT|nr:2-enoyl thioester reductase domain-containing protein [Nitrospirillum amazonense]ASG22236.1 alcohol dehydrogenase [Nitrospirillum amazonense CBAmc]TWB30998.1 NADPH:quinone reductase-like Zn-dependent oxidoreductase [Nitrospirillum amazonense]
MKAAIIAAAGQLPEVRHLPDPGPPGLGQVLVAMLLAPINPADRQVITRSYAFPMSYPLILGAEGVGRVMALGPGVQGIAEGDRVLPLDRGNWCSHRLMSADRLIVIPSDVPDDQAAMLRINPATAWRLLDQARLGAGDWVIQNGANSAVARWVRLLASQRGVGVVNVARSPPAHRPDAEIWLADGPDLPTEVARALRDRPVPLAFDCVAGPATARLASCVSPDGQVVIFGHLSGEDCVLPSGLLTGRGLIVRGFSLRPAEATEAPATVAALYSRLARLACRPEAHTPVAATYPLDALSTALSTAGCGVGRVLLALDR